MKKLTIGTRGSQLALWQANWIAARLAELGVETHIEIIKTTGDKITDVALSQISAAGGGKGVFTKEIEEALLAGSIDLAVHSLKDLPTELDERLCVAAVPERADPHDALVGAHLDALPTGARVGTSSLRRTAQLRAARPDLELLEIRGNVDTRLRKLDEGQYDAILLACAGLRRLGWAERITEALDPALITPAPGQGALGIETRADDAETREILAAVHHEPSSQAVTAERSLLAALGGGCQVPLGAFALHREEALRLQAVVVSQDGETRLTATGEGKANEAVALGASVASELLDSGAQELVDSAT